MGGVLRLKQSVSHSPSNGAPRYLQGAGKCNDSSQPGHCRMKRGSSTGASGLHVGERPLFERLERFLFSVWLRRAKLTYLPHCLSISCEVTPLLPL